MLFTALWSVTFLFAAVLVVGSIRSGGPFSRVATNVLLGALWLVIGAVMVFEVVPDERAILLAAFAVGGCYALLRSAVGVDLIE